MKKKIAFIFALALLQSAPQLFYGSTPATKEDFLRAMDQSQEILMANENFKINFEVSTRIQPPNGAARENRSEGRLINCSGKIFLEADIEYIRENHIPPSTTKFIDDRVSFLSMSVPEVIQVFTPDSTERFSTDRWNATGVLAPDFKIAASGIGATIRPREELMEMLSGLDCFRVFTRDSENRTEFIAEATHPLDFGPIILRLSINSHGLLEWISYEEPNNETKYSSEYTYQYFQGGWFPETIRTHHLGPRSSRMVIEGLTRYFDLQRYQCDDMDLFSIETFVQKNATEGLALQRISSAGRKGFLFRNGVFISSEDLIAQRGLELTSLPNQAGESTSIATGRVILAISLILLGIISFFIFQRKP